MKTLLNLTAVIEASAGLALLVWPSSAVALVFGSAPVTPAGLAIARIGGAGLLTLGIACWQARQDAHNRTADGLIRAMLFYNVAAASSLAYARLGEDLSGVGLWPGAILHAAMAGWCAASFRVTTPSRPDATRN
jgi:hypothetical protein